MLLLFVCRFVRISLGGEGNALYPVLSSYLLLPMNLYNLSTKLPIKCQRRFAVFLRTFCFRSHDDTKAYITIAIRLRYGYDTTMTKN